MDTFDYLKSKYLDAKLQFLNYIILDISHPCQGEKGFKPKEKVCGGIYAQKREEAFVNILNAADMMVDYIAQKAMANIESLHYMCYFEGRNLIIDEENPKFPFKFKFMALPEVSWLERTHPELEDLIDRIKYGKIDISLLAQELDKAGVPHSEIDRSKGYSDHELMNIPFEDLINNLQDSGECLIKEFSDEDTQIR